MPERVTRTNEISLNAVKYPLVGPVQSTVASLYPPKIVIGDVGGNSQSHASTVTWRDFSGGIGLERIRDSGDFDRCWESELMLLYASNLILPPYVSDVADPTIAGTVSTIGHLASEIFATFSAGDDVRRYAAGPNVWTASLDTLPGNAIQLLNGRVAGTVYLFFSHFFGWTFTSDGTSFSDNTKDTLYMAIWDDRIWGIDNTGQLWYRAGAPSTTEADCVDDAQLPLRDRSIQGLFVGPDATGEPILYAVTNQGLYAHDAANSRFIETGLTYPEHDAGAVGVTWRGSIYVGVGTGVYRYAPGPTAVITVVGLDRDSGLSSDKVGEIKALIGGHNWMFALVGDATTDAVYAYNERGWAMLTDQTDGVAMHVTTSNGYPYNLWCSDISSGNGIVRNVQLPEDVISPDHISGNYYEAVTDANHDLPWFDAFQDEVDKLALRLRIEVANAAANQAVGIFYRLDYSTSAFTQLGSDITSSGVTTLQFPNSTTPSGTVFRSIQLRIELNTNDATKSPNVRSLTLEFRKKLPARWGHSFEVDISKEYAGNTPLQLRAALLTAVGSNALVEFTLRNDDGGTRNFFVDVVQATGLEQTGEDERGRSRVSVVEV